MDKPSLRQLHINEMGSVAIRKHELQKELEDIEKRLDELTIIISTIDRMKSENDKPE